MMNVDGEKNGHFGAFGRSAINAFERIQQGMEPGEAIFVNSIAFLFSQIFPAPFLVSAVKAFGEGQIGAGILFGAIGVVPELVISTMTIPAVAKGIRRLRQK